MDVHNLVTKRLRELYGKGTQVLAAAKSDGMGGYYLVDTQRASQWKISCLNILQRAFGEESLHSKEYVKATEQLDYESVKIGNSILMAALDDLEGGYLADVRRLMEADLFSEFLDQAEHLLSIGYYQAAAVVAGCVLEDALRKMCQQNPDIELPDKPKLSWMNDRLKEHNVYNNLTHKRITANSDIRNKAAHGQWEEFDKDDVKEMMSSIKAFMEKYFG